MELSLGNMLYGCVAISFPPIQFIEDFKRSGKLK